MPRSMCPRCGQRSLHLLGSRQVWDQKYGDMEFTPILCSACTCSPPGSGPAEGGDVRLAKGERVVIRRGVSREGRELGGWTGEVRWVDSSEEGSLYWVSVSNEYPDCFIRSELVELASEQTSEGPVEPLG